jgi:hypothetical protein
MYESLNGIMSCGANLVVTLMEKQSMIILVSLLPFRATDRLLLLVLISTTAIVLLLDMYESSSGIMSCGANLVVTLMEKQLVILLAGLSPFRATDRLLLLVLHGTMAILVICESSNGIMSCGANLVVTLMEKQLVIFLAPLLPFRAKDRLLILVLHTTMVPVMYESSNGIMSCGANLVVTLMEKQLMISLAGLLPFRATDRLLLLVLIIGNGLRAGHVRTFKWNNELWSQLGGDIDGEAANDQSGRAVAFSSDGSTVAIGAYKNDGNGSNAGHVRVYNLEVGQ